MQVDLSGLVLIAIAAILIYVFVIRKPGVNPPQPPVPIPPDPAGAPIVYGFFSPSCPPYGWMEKVELCMSYRVAGCGANVTKFGAISPENRSLTFEWHIVREGEMQEDSVFDRSGENMVGYPIPDPIVVWFNGWQQDTPPYPFYINPLVNPLACPPNPPTPPVPPPASTVKVHFLCIVRDDLGRSTEYRITSLAMPIQCKS